VDRFDNMRVFARVVESGSFTGAAARLGISASMVSQHVKELEEWLGARLLNRTTRKVSLTETGRAYYERCTRLLADLEETEQAVSDMHAAPCGELRVNAAPSFGILQLAPAIADFTARFPAISVELMLTIRIADLIDEGFDVAVWVGEASGLEPDRAPTRPLPHGRLRRAEVFREARHAADTRRSRNPQLPHGGCDWIILLPHVASDGGRRHCAEHRAYWKHAHQQWGGAQSRRARWTRPGVSADLSRRRRAAVGAAGDGAGRLHGAAASAARPLPAQPPSIG
jgi:DNA-binding transcriptional LysR family regulator